MLQGSRHLLGGIVLLVFWIGTVPNESTAQAVASSVNFTVLAPTQRLADKVVGHADAFRKEIANDWLGSELPAPAHRVSLYLKIDPTRSFARTLLDAQQGRHLVWLVGSEQAVTEHLLKHEVAHTVLATRFGNTMPAWANEGIASQYDNHRRRDLRQKQLAGFVAIDSWPHLDRLLQEPIHQPWNYAAAVSLTDYLIHRDSPTSAKKTPASTKKTLHPEAKQARQRFLKFVDLATQQGWATALRTHYQIDSLADLETQWHQSVRAEKQIARPAALRMAAPPVSKRLLR